jgi:asparagine synthase (glutamine-hydrolysing)
MSGIVGIYNLDRRPVEQTDIQRMVDSIAHRGPDGSGVWTDGPVGFGHRMLWTTPESLHEKLPLTNKAGNLTITADARIDNRDELISTLNLNGRPLETIPDSEIILAAYEKWGEKCPEKLLGDFSFAIWDKRKEIIYCARDPIGIKPFHYYFKDGKFRWSSEPKAIFEDKTIPKEPNFPLICLYLLNRFDEREETLYKDVYRLPPSHFMVLENGRIRKDQYWDVDPNYAIRYKTDQEYAECFLELFKEAIRARLRSHGPVGALLSGGLDSSSIVCTVQKLFHEKSIIKNGFETFSIVSDILPFDERLYIHEVVNKYNIYANYFKHEDHLSSVDFEQTKQYHDVRYFPTLLFLAPIFRDARQKRIKVMLDGSGGDDLLAADFDHLTDFMVQGKIRSLFTQLRCDATIFSYSPYSLFFNYCLKPLIPQPIKQPIKQLLKPFRKNGIPPWLNMDCLKKTGVNERLQNFPCSLRFPTHSQQRIFEILRYSWNANIVRETLENFNAYFGIELRFPFFDRRLVEFSIAVPEEQRWRGEWSKMMLRKSMEGILPDSIRLRGDKAEFSCVINFEFEERQLKKLRDMLQLSALAGLEIIQSNQLQQLFEDNQKGPANDNLRNALKNVVWLELWLRSQWADLKKEGINDQAERSQS